MFQRLFFSRNNPDKFRLNVIGPYQIVIKPENK